MHVRGYAHAHAWMDGWMDGWMDLYIYTYTHLSIYLSVCLSIYLYVNRSIYIYTRTYISMTSPCPQSISRLSSSRTASARFLNLEHRGATKAQDATIDDFSGQPSV